MAPQPKSYPFLLNGVGGADGQTKLLLETMDKPEMKAVTMDIHAIGAHFRRESERIITREKFGGKGTLDRVLSTITDSKDYRIVLMENTLENSAEVISVFGTGIADFATAEDTEECLESLLSAEDPMVLNSDPAPARVLETTRLGRRATIVRVCILVHFAGRPVADNERAGSWLSVTRSPPGNPPALLAARPAPGNPPALLAARPPPGNPLVLLAARPPPGNPPALLAARPPPGNPPTLLAARPGNAGARSDPSGGPVTNVTGVAAVTGLDGGTAVAVRTTGGNQAARPPAAVVVQRLDLPKGTAEQVDIDHGQYYIKQGFCDELTGVLPLALKYLPPAADGHGPIRHKDMHPEKQKGKGAQDTDKYPRQELTAEDRRRGELRVTSLIVATGAAVERILSASSKFPFLLLHRMSTHLEYNNTSYGVPRSNNSHTQCPPDVENHIKKRHTTDVGASLKRANGSPLPERDLVKAAAAVADWEKMEKDLRAIDGVLRRYNHQWSDRIEAELEDLELEHDKLRLYATLGLDKDKTWACAVRILMAAMVEVHPEAVKIFCPTLAAAAANGAGAGAPPAANGAEPAANGAGPAAAALPPSHAAVDARPRDKRVAFMLTVDEQNQKRTRRNGRG
ncbi:hypothetical protein PLESTB_001310900 [Pleodorina starrii]|uniref:Uncharacterized protein n=1 Tax=Pleodorina starrii TaxID=330485 RepID=A0A9W6F6Z8_9CHLO|nr:hypothetical protein PLESTM_000959800 [Pleodorina starrii]GLC58036.1 hypothetical protein PLESTB_001310900 [Pleodorina starrii]GLC70061.1 hypothetical protein PLESTF_000919000 [Pleodorina starrii]